MEVEGLLEKAKMIVDAEEVHPSKHWYPECLHIKQPAEFEDAAGEEHPGISGRIRQDINRLEASLEEHISSTNEISKRMEDARFDQMRAEMKAMEARLTAAMTRVLKPAR